LLRDAITPRRFADTFSHFQLPLAADSALSMPAALLHDMLLMLIAASLRLLRHAAHCGAYF